MDTSARVINTTDEPVAGLHASGDVIGLSQLSVLHRADRNAVFSYLAGRNAAARLGRN